MRTLVCLIVLLKSLLLAGIVSANAISGQFSTDLDAGDYDAVITVQPLSPLSQKAAVRLALESGKKNSSVAIVLTRTALSLDAVSNGKRRAVAEIPTSVTPGKSYRLTVMRRGNLLGIMENDRLLGRAELPPAGGPLAGVTADAGWKISEARVQRIEPVVFADDFMRDATEQNSPWAQISGGWHIKSAWDNILHGVGRINDILNHSRDTATSQAQNPFAWVGARRDGKAAVCTTGNTFWEDYTYSLSVQPARDGACGMLCNLTPTGDALLVRWTSARDREQGGNRLGLYRYSIRTGTMTEIASSPGGYIPGQWYRLTVVSSLGSLKISVDGDERIARDSVTPWRGSVGLYADSTAGTIFDDVAVYGRTLDLDLLFESKQQSITRKFIEDRNGMQDWASNQGDWIPDYAVNRFRWYVKDLFGDYSWMSLTINPPANTGGELWLLLNGDGRNPNSGYKAVLKIDGGKPASLTYMLYRDATVLAKKTVEPLVAGTEYAVHFWHVNNQLKLEVDGDTVLEAADGGSLPGLRPACRNDGTAFANITQVHVQGRNMLDYPFTDAPVDWLSDGNWEPSIRWSCTPDWSFLAGWSRGDAVLWQKKRFAGAHSIEAYVGTKMEYPRETDTYFNRQGYFAVSLCSDGREPRNGYAGIYGYPDENGVPLGRAVILRNGVIVAQTPVTRRSWAANHRAWFYLNLNKRGNVIDFTAKVAGEVYKLSYTDTAPIEEGIPAVWTFNNAMTVARVRLDFSAPPTPRSDPRLVSPTPWYPEWANLGDRLTLDLSDSWSSTGNPVSWKVLPAETPAGDEQAVSLNNGKLTFQPKMAGNHWYRIAAWDGAARSQEFHLSLPVFTPSIKRDDSRALVLYRFDEGKGLIVHDRSPITPPLDLKITPDPDGIAALNDGVTIGTNPDADPSSIKWVPGQGLKLRGGAKALQSDGPADKLLKLKETKSASLECWASTETLFSNFGRSSCFFSWESAQPNLPVGQMPVPYLGFASIQDSVCLATGGVAFASVTTGYTTSLHHLMLTWDGTTTTVYYDGVKLGDSKLAWNPDKWAAGAALYVGNQQNHLRPLIGSIYLLAIHDRCFTADMVKQHFLAGPSAGK